MEDDDEDRVVVLIPQQGPPGAEGGEGGVAEAGVGDGGGSVAVVGHGDAQVQRCAGGDRDVARDRAGVTVSSGVDHGLGDDVSDLSGEPGPGPQHLAGVGVHGRGVVQEARPVAGDLGQGLVKRGRACGGGEWNVVLGGVELGLDAGEERENLGAGVCRGGGVGEGAQFGEAQ